MFRLETIHFVLLTPRVLFQFRYGGAFLPTLCSPHSLFAQILRISCIGFPLIHLHNDALFPFSSPSLFICL